MFRAKLALSGAIAAVLFGFSPMTQANPGISPLPLHPAAMAPFYGTPYVVAPAGYGSTGQIPQQRYINWTPVYIANHFQRTGSQPMGYSEMPPVGLSAIGNSLGYSNFRNNFFSGGAR